jgi:biotin transport system substrate-specific component
MTTIQASQAPSLLQDKRLALLGVAGFTVALAAAAQVAIPIPGTPVPITLQPMVVVLAGMMLGPAFGASSMLLYLALGAAGLPVFAPVGAPGIARLLGPTGGYLIAFPFAAFAAGMVAHRFPTFIGRWAGAMLGMVVIFAGGIAQLTILTGSVRQALAFGLTPFAAFDVLKALVAAAVARPWIRSARD